jgi:hypothetical protein
MSYPVPLKIRVPKSFQGSKITAIRIQDVARNVWYSWDNGVWDNTGGTGNNAPVGQTPMITPGPNNLYISFYTLNKSHSAVNMSLYIYDGNYNILAQKINIYTAAGSGQGLEYNGLMPSGSYTIILWSEP